MPHALNSSASATSSRTTLMPSPITMATCRPDTDSRCARPLSRIAATASSGMGVWLPVSMALDTVPVAPLPSTARTRCSSRLRSPEKPVPPGEDGAASSRSTGARAEALPALPSKKADRW